jgi:hypothetical protein
LSQDSNIQGASERPADSFVRILLNDASASIARMRLTDSDLARRDVIRTCFAAIEGIIWTYREFIVSTAKDLDLLQSDEESALSEVTFQVGHNGSLSKQPRFIPLLAGFRLSTRIALRIDKSITVEFNSEGWQQMLAAMRIRNRVTHPKSHADLTISTSDIDVCLNAMYWILEVHLHVLSATTSALARFLDQMWEILAGLRNGDSQIIADYKRAQESIDRAT